MTRDEHGNIITQIMGMINPDNQADASTLLTSLSEDYNNVLTDYEKSCENVNTLEEKNQQLRNANSELFLKVGHTQTETKQDDFKSDEKDDIKSFDDLFNEKGDLK